MYLYKRSFTFKKERLEAEDSGAQIQFQETLQAQAARVEPSHLQD